VITVPRTYAKEVADLVTELGIKGIWNFTSVKLTVPVMSPSKTSI
jgi:NADH/NAD ratio-sensing transcriptional regulator Rex